MTARNTGKFCLVYKQSGPHLADFMTLISQLGKIPHMFFNSFYHVVLIKSTLFLCMVVGHGTVNQVPLTEAIQMSHAVVSGHRDLLNIFTQCEGISVLLHYVLHKKSELTNNQLSLGFIRTFHCSHLMRDYFTAVLQDQCN